MSTKQTLLYIFWPILGVGLVAALIILWKILKDV